MGLGIAGAGAVIAFAATQVNVSPIYAKVGPAAFLWLASILMIGCGLTVVLKSRSSAPDENSELKGPAFMLAGLLASVLLLEPLGFIPVATLLFVLTARGLGSTRLVRDFCIGLAVCIAAYFLFAKGLGLKLPLGTLFT